MWLKVTSKFNRQIWAVCFGKTNSRNRELTLLPTYLIAAVGQQAARRDPAAVVAVKAEQSGGGDEPGSG
jgi:hypothetical protein